MNTHTYIYNALANIGKIHVFTQETFTKIDHILSHKTKLNRFESVDIKQCILSMIGEKKSIT